MLTNVNTVEQLMPFQEKSAWIMSVALLASSLFYFGVVMSVSQETGHLAAPVLPVVVIYTAILTLIAILGHIIIAVLTPKDANAAPDERERVINFRASHFSGYVFGVGVIVSLGLYLFIHDGNLLFYSVFGSLIISQLSEYLFQIFLSRTVVV